MANPKNTRKCIVCKQHSDKSELIRIALIKNGGICVDREGKAEGRGAWVHKSTECISALIKKKGLNRAFKGAVPDAVYEEIKRILE